MQLDAYRSLSPSELAGFLLPLFRDEYASLFIHLFRTLTAFEMLTHAETYERFLPGLEGLATLRAAGNFDVHGQSADAESSGEDGGGGSGNGADSAREGAVPSMEAVVQALVLRDGVDAEHLMIQALATLLDLPLAVVYTGGAATVRVRSCAYAALPSCCMLLCVLAAAPPLYCAHWHGCAVRVRG